MNCTVWECQRCGMQNHITDRSCEKCGKEYCDDVYDGFNEHCDYEPKSPKPRFEKRGMGEHE